MKPASQLIPCEPRAFVTRTCERGFKGCDVLHERSYRIEDLLDKLAAAGVEITINGRTA